MYKYTTHEFLFHLGDVDIAEVIASIKDSQGNITNITPEVDGGDVSFSLTQAQTGGMAEGPASVQLHLRMVDDSAYQTDPQYFNTRAVNHNEVI